MDASYGAKPPKAYEGKEKYIFISYSHKDKEYVWPIIEELNSEGYRVWYDDGIDPGTEWARTIAEHLQSCYVFVSIISDNYIESQNCIDELHYSRELKKKGLLVYLNDIEMPPELQMRFGMRQAIHKYFYAKEDVFYQKFYKSEGFEACKGPSPKPPEETPPKKSPKSPKPKKEDNTTTDNIEKKPREVVFRPSRAQQESFSSAGTEESEGIIGKITDIIGKMLSSVLGTIVFCLLLSFVMVFFYEYIISPPNLTINDGEVLNMYLGETIPLSDISFEGEDFTEADLEDAEIRSDSNWLVDIYAGEIVATTDPKYLYSEDDDGIAYETAKITVNIDNDSGKWKGKLKVRVNALE